MKVSCRVMLALVAALALVGSRGALAQEKGGEKAKGARAGMPSEEETMKAWMAASTPGEAHKRLEPLVGSFTVKTKSWMAPGAPPEESGGTCENKWVLGNRFIEERCEGTMMNQPFSGIGYTGYDNYKKKYVGTWMDSLGTMIMSSTGTMDASGKKLTSWSTIDDVVRKKPERIKSVMTIADNDHQTFEMFGPGPDGKVFKMMEMQYTRKK